jgi:glycosyltransferase EpsE
MGKALVSVIMGIYNCEDTLGESIECIINQTYKNWELIMCDNGSEDNTISIAENYSRQYPDKIFLIKNKKNLGLNISLNNCLKFAKGKYIARMDGDDLCSPNRLEKEVNFLEEHLEYDIVSTNMIYFDEQGVFGRSYSNKNPQVKDIIKGTPFCHAPCMVRKHAYDAVDGYSVDKKLLRVEDYHLWIKMYANGYRGYNIQETLYQMRDDRNAIKRRKFKYRINEAYVKLVAVKLLNLPKWYLIYSLGPIIVGMIPEIMYEKLHKKRLSHNASIGEK